MVTKKNSGFVLLIMSFMILFGCCSATVYKVGDSSGWIAKKDAYHSWVKDKVFYVGDSLVFQYDRNVNDVAQVSNASAYASCNSRSPKTVYNTGHDVVNLTEPGHHYFITSTHIQCVYGLKLDVLVVNDPSRPTPPPPAKVPEPSRPVSSPTTPPPSKTKEPSRPVSSPPTPAPSKTKEPSRSLPPTPPPAKVHEPSTRPIPPPPPTPAPSNSLPSGKIYKVGDKKGWSVYNSFYYYRWSQLRQFHVGDSLLFKYNRHINDVEEISDEVEFRSCAPNSTVAAYKTGHDLVKLTEQGVHYFVSMKTGLCRAGIKLRVDVLPATQAVPTPNVPRTWPPIHRPYWPWRWFNPFRFRPHH